MSQVTAIALPAPFFTPAPAAESANVAARDSQEDRA